MQDIAISADGKDLVKMTMNSRVILFFSSVNYAEERQ